MQNYRDRRTDAGVGGGGGSSTIVSFVCCILTTSLFSLARAPSLVSALSLSCRDKSLCQTYSSCSTRDALLRSGHLCHGFPVYNGGPPIVPFKWDSESKTYTCLSRNGSVCVKWRTQDEFPPRGMQVVGSCQCDQLELEHCQTWSCLRQEASLCTPPSWDCGSAVGLADGTKLTISCCLRDGEGGVIARKREIQKETTRCVCKKTVSEFGSGDGGHRKAAKSDYCAQWDCKGQHRSSAEEDEQYVCTGFEETYCAGWEGVSEETEELELSKCECTIANTTSEGQRYCAKWGCVERDIHYHDPKLTWAALGIVLGTGPLLVFCLFVLESPICASFCLSLWACLVFVTTFLGGVGALLITLVCQSVIIVLVAIFGWKRRPRPTGSPTGTTSSPKAEAKPDTA